LSHIRFLSTIIEKTQLEIKGVLQVLCRKGKDEGEV